ncbi:hemin uptake protein HemP [Janthinobacterium fluminis]|uniref:Hemin uptake protein HemP n=1 Tax=Janthinobacterium fluminis TaxID=2987524 RepID=A0ABT5K2C5_9BURK|nr:hemin uptake protein HemP [Janthinobacterium fluminis]MDC8759136.1 hemin uptake protein HemP [Janthinobacterium fluminis]
MHSQKTSTSTEATSLHARHAAATVQAPLRITSAALLQERREVEIEHGGKIYRLRVTQLNKLILTA